MAIRRSYRTTPPRRFRPRVEVLESRLPLAGNVTAVQVGASLFIEGDDDFNHLGITGNGEGSFVVEGGATYVNGQWGASLSFSGVANIYMNLRGGDDRAAFSQTKLPGTFVFRGGDGNDDLRFDWGAVGDHSFGRFMAFLGAGDDTISALDEKSFTVRQSFVVHGGSGENFVDLRTDVSLNLGVVAIVGGRGSDVVLLSDGTTNVRSIVMMGSDGYNKIEWLGNVNIDGYVIQTGGSGQDVFGSFGFTRKPNFIAGPVLLQLGDGYNDVAFHGSTVIAGNLQMTSGSGDDEFIAFDSFFEDQIDHFAAREIVLDLGDGENVVSFTQESSELQSLSVVTGSGLDRFDFYDVVARGQIALNAGAGDNRLKVINSEFFAPFSWVSGGGKDWLIVECSQADDGRGTRFRASVFFGLGDGNDLLWVGAFDPIDSLEFESSVVFAGGLGNDTYATEGLAEYAFPPLIDSFE